MTIDDHTAAGAAITSYLMMHASGEPPALREKIITAVSSHPSPVSRYHDLIETIYANRGNASEDAKTLAASLARFAAGQGFTGFATDRRGALIADILEGQTVTGEPELKSLFVVQGEV